MRNKLIRWTFMIAVCVSAGLLATHYGVTLTTRIFALIPIALLAIYIGEKLWPDASPAKPGPTKST